MQTCLRTNKVLARAQADVHAIDSNGMTAKDFAIKHKFAFASTVDNFDEVIRLLAAHEAKQPRPDLNKGDKRSLKSQLIGASMKGDAETVKRLLERGANVNTRDHEQWTPLAFAAEAVRGMSDGE